MRLFVLCCLIFVACNPEIRSSLPAFNKIDLYGKYWLHLDSTATASKDFQDGTPQQYAKLFDFGEITPPLFRQVYDSNSQACEGSEFFIGIPYRFNPKRLGLSMGTNTTWNLISPLQNDSLLQVTRITGDTIVAASFIQLKDGNWIFVGRQQSACDTQEILRLPQITEQ